MRAPHEHGPRRYGPRERGQPGSDRRGRGRCGRARRKPETPSVADQLAEGDVKVQRRRPGDGGGAQGQTRMAVDPAAQGEDAPKKRRRRRNRKPKQDGPDGSGSAAQQAE